MKRFDLFPKLADETFEVKTTLGGAISLFSIVMWAVVIYSEVQNMRNPIDHQELYVAPPRKLNKNMSVSLNLTVAFPCQLLRIAIRDFSGNHELDFQQSLARQRLDMNLRPFAPFLYDNDPQSPYSQCTKCYGGRNKCCLTCYDVVASHDLANEPIPNLDGIPQCKRDKASVEDAEACKIVARLSTELGHGEIVITAGGDTKLPLNYKSDLSLLGETINMSHWIESLVFGDPIGDTNTLDGIHFRQPSAGYFQFKYDLGLVETLALNGVHGKRYSASFTQKQILNPVTKRRPGIVFRFTNSPFGLKEVKRQNTIRDTVTKILAIVGGSFALAGILDSVLHTWKYPNGS